MDIKKILSINYKKVYLQHPQKIDHDTSFRITYVIVKISKQALEKYSSNKSENIWENSHILLKCLLRKTNSSWDRDQIGIKLGIKRVIYQTLVDLF